MQGSVAVSAVRVAPHVTKAQAKGFPFFFSLAGDRQIAFPVSGEWSGRARPKTSAGRYFMVIEQWQAYVQQVVNLFSHGYFYFCPVKYPQAKVNRWSEIDKKLIDKYSANQDKDRRYRNRQNENANYMLVRHGDQCLLLKTEGDEKKVVDPDHWQDIRTEPYFFRCGSVTLKIRRANEKTDVRLEKRCYRQIKGNLAFLVAQKPFPKDYIVRTFELLNGLPCYAGIIDQKIAIRKQIIAEARQHQGRIAPKDLWINTKRKIYSVRNQA
jgi:hypothetical protein